MKKAKKQNSEKIKFILDNKEVEGKRGEYLLDVAKRHNIEIPHICTNERLERIGSCRLCVVEIQGMKRLAPSCSTYIREGMVVNTRSPRVLKARRINIELLLANHDRDCLTCNQNLNCKLQRYSEDLLIHKIRYEGEKRKEKKDKSSISIWRDNEKCILCEQCTRVCNGIQTVYAIGKQNRGFDMKVAPPLGLNMEKSNCVNCGQCVIVCPTGALSENSDIEEVTNALNSGKFLVAQTAPSIRATLGECFNMKPGTVVTGKMVAALKAIGFDKVFSTDFAADITIVEEATEFVKRFKENRDLPMITTCCPAWIKFAEQFYFEQLNHMSSCRSPQAMLASLVKTYYAKKINKKPKDIIVVDIMPCTAKKFEIQRDEFKGEADYVLTTVELAKLIKQYNIDFVNLEKEEFDNPLGESTGAGTIFGKTGGVMEAALRTAADYLTKKDLRKIDYKQIRGFGTIKEGSIKLAGKEIKVCAVHTLGEARKIMEDIREGNCAYHFVEIMACYGGCIGGGGQPRYDDIENLKQRQKAIIDNDKKTKIRKSHLNPSVIKIYKEYIGKPGQKRAHRLLHTKYKKRCYL